MKQKNLIYSLLKVYSLVMILVITSFAVTVSYATFDRNRKDTAKVTQQTASRLADILSENENKINRIAIELTNNQEKVANLFDYFQLSYSDYLSQSLSREGIEGGISSIYLPQKIANLYYADDKIESIAIDLKNYQEILYSNEQKKMGSKEKRMPDLKNQLTLSKTLMNPNTSEQIGTLYVTFSKQELNTIIDNSGAKNQLQTFIFSDRMKQLYANKIPSNNGMLQAEIEKGITKNSEIDFLSLSQQYYIYGSETASGMQVLTAVSKKSVAIQSFNAIFFILLGSALINLFLLYFLYRIFRKYAYQVEDIVASVSQVSSGKLDWRITTADKEAELKDISTGINQMLDGINQYIEDIYTLEIKQKDAHMRALQSQINPHFLYNTLEYIRMYAVSEGAEELADVVYTFATLLRNNTSQEKTTTLKKELEFCEKYVYLYQMRYPGNIAYSFAIDSAIENLVIPKFSIQPLIENYFVHGIDYMRIDNVISVKANIEEDKITILIRDNGKGMSSEKIKDLNQSLMESHSKFGGSIGILNVNERLRSYFGESYRMCIQETQAHGVTISISFEKEKEEV
ncbi:sensor histidine kinase [Carnobacterium maltaromaticum]|uniref:Sensor histidine kinase n=2 Tax=Carnobacterium maltaromaticum TaxID=2751 RepID=A0AAW9JXU2_CARML|nr:sensor histidine kinase [Carnobacterium maltaromaticum]MDT1944508.1 sensor histidine kinase [Carnobacterium maltaromaticum]MDT1997770.1 sensor histidine kinase [Carnobacterium maltaromaticum]MDZ5758460.1 sensor histidine kinase [Carnobacterium maltaromaticum]TFJ27189.1 sensor histidine kinase [Carnobacterium maltaromaticum]TFJ31261.1 sensor histidine kinase [Carnobacterium maltaromaticum]